MKQLLDEAKKLISMNSVTTHGNEEVANHLVSLTQSKGLKTALQKVTHSFESLSKRQYNVVGILGDPLVDRKTRKGLLLGAALDTPTPGHPEFWDKTDQNPWGPKIDDGRLYGLGATSGKLDYLAKLYAIDRFREKKLKQPIYLVGSCASEMGMLGSNYLIKSYFLNPKQVVIYAPTQFKVLNQSKAMAFYQVSIDYHSIEKDARGFNRRIDFHALGKSSHGAHPGDGKNAIQEMLGFLGTASDNGFEIRVTRMEGGDSFNKVPDYAFSQFYLTSYQFEDFKPFFREIAHQSGNEKNFRVDLGGLGDVGVRFLPDAVVQAMYEMVHFFNEVAEELKKAHDPEFSPPFSTVNLSRIEQTTQGLRLHFDMRSLPQLKVESLNEKLNLGVNEISKHYPNLNISLHRQRIMPSYMGPRDSSLSQACLDVQRGLGIDSGFVSQCGMNEVYLFDQAGYDAVALGPGSESSSSHAPNDSILIDDLDRSLEFYTKLIEKTCL